jgi:hypothetical protein
VVVDKNGDPRVMFHGTDAGGPFTVFEPGKGRKTIAAFFSETEDHAHMYGRNIYPVYLSVKRPFDYRKDKKEVEREVENFYRTRGGIKEPWVVNALLRRYDTTLSDSEYEQAEDDALPSSRLRAAPVVSALLAGDWRTFEDEGFVEYLRYRGYDALVMTELGNVNYAIFDPRQVKSASGNVGTFDPNDPDIRHNPKQRTRTTMARHNPADPVEYRCYMGQFPIYDEDPPQKGDRYRVTRKYEVESETGWLPLGLYEVVDIEKGTRSTGSFAIMRRLDEQNPRRRNPSVTREERAALVTLLTREVNEACSRDRKALIRPEYLEHVEENTEDEPWAAYAGWTKRALSRSIGIPVLGYGGGRIAGRLPDGSVVKIPHNGHGYRQNHNEVRRYATATPEARALLLPLLDTVIVDLPPPVGWNELRVPVLVVPEVRPLRSGVAADERLQQKLEARWDALVERGEAEWLEDMRPENSGVYTDPATGEQRVVILDYALP